MELSKEEYTNSLNNYDKFVTLKSTDTIVFAEPKYDSTEKILVKLQNELAMFGCDIETVPSDKEILHHASREDLMLMIKLINPKYYMPVKGEYRYMVNNANLASILKIPDNNIVLKQNGDVVTFIDGKLANNFSRIKVDDVLDILKDLKNRNIKITPMHMDDKEYITELINSI